MVYFYYLKLKRNNMTQLNFILLRGIHNLLQRDDESIVAFQVRNKYAVEYNQILNKFEEDAMFEFGFINSKLKLLLNK